MVLVLDLNPTSNDRFPFAVAILDRNLAAFSDCKLSFFETDGDVGGRC